MVIIFSYSCRDCVLGTRALSKMNGMFPKKLMAELRKCGVNALTTDILDDIEQEQLIFWLCFQE